MSQRPGASLPPQIRDLLRTQKCGKKTCLGIGRWAPIIKVKVHEQKHEHETCVTLVPTLLCDRCKDVTRMGDLLTETGKSVLTMKVLEKRNKRLNWDTAELEWRDMRGKIPEVRV